MLRNRTPGVSTISMPGLHSGVGVIMQFSHLARTGLLLQVLLTSSLTSAGEPWKVAGAGNSTCTEWKAGGPAQQNEILSWMMGFASAVDVSYASRGLPRVQLDRLSNDYLRGETTATCANSENANMPMVSIIFQVLKDLPLK
jgi:hypothetical protein